MVPCGFQIVSGCFLALTNEHRNAISITSSRLRSSWLKFSVQKPWKTTRMSCECDIELRRIRSLSLFRAFDGVVPPHFYGEMSKTELGCQVLSERGHFGEFSHFIRQHGLESEDLEVILKLKSILWAVVRNRIILSFAD